MPTQLITMAAPWATQASGGSRTNKTERSSELTKNDIIIASYLCFHDN
jgi:hypothetical protein